MEKWKRYLLILETTNEPQKHSHLPASTSPCSAHKHSISPQFHQRHQWNLTSAVWPLIFRTVTQTDVPDAYLISAEQGFFLPISMFSSLRRRERDVTVVMEMVWLWRPKCSDANKIGLWSFLLNIKYSCKFYTLFHTGMHTDLISPFSKFIIPGGCFMILPWILLPLAPHQVLLRVNLSLRKNMQQKPSPSASSASPVWRYLSSVPGP